MDTNRFKAARKRAGLTLTEMADRLGVSANLPGNWERGERKPSIEKLTAIAKLLQVSVSWLTGDTISDPQTAFEKGEGSAAILGDWGTAPGLRDLAANATLTAGLAITPDEWDMLRSLKAPDDFTANGYITVLMAIRTATEKPVTRS
ncbi:MAG: helix-turn-helix domain-containing protein [Gammaproteobacteria bacterium SHHR-1]